MFNFKVLYIVVDSEFVNYYLKEVEFNDSNNVSSYINEDSVVSQNLCDVHTKLLLRQSKYDSSIDSNLEEVFVNDYKFDKVVHKLKSSEEAV
ncbi:hypothetical protein [Companilactobacillus sp. FL22-1]|uniref:hypothetical protein n=1 Tax=Companilactobacillus sp. FL22-1 TaxID=3373892 RepID=UPI0037553903